MALLLSDQSQNELLSGILRGDADKLVENSVKVLTASARIARKNMIKEHGRLEVMRRCAAENKDCDCNGLWVPSALYILHRSNVSKEDFSTAIMNAIIQGAGKGTTLILCGSPSSGKSWLLNPIMKLYKCMYSPGSQGNFNLIDIPQVEVLLWQDFRYDIGTSKCISWGQWLNISGGETLLIGVPQGGAGAGSNINHVVRSSDRCHALKLALVTFSNSRAIFTFFFWAPQLLGTPTSVQVNTTSSRKLNLSETDQNGPMSQFEGNRICHGSKLMSKSYRSDPRNHIGRTLEINATNQHRNGLDSLQSCQLFPRMDFPTRLKSASIQQRTRRLFDW